MTTEQSDAIIIRVGLAALVKHLLYQDSENELMKFLVNYSARSNYSTTLTWVENVGCNLMLKWFSRHRMCDLLPEWQKRHGCMFVGVEGDKPRNHVMVMKFSDPVQAGMFRLQYTELDPEIT